MEQHRGDINPIPLALLRKKYDFAITRILHETPHALSVIDLLKLGVSNYQLRNVFRYSKEEILEAHVCYFRELKTLNGHRRSVSTIRKINEQMLLSSGGNGKIILWDIPNGYRIQEWDIEAEPVNCVTLLDDGTFLLGCGHVIKHWDPIAAQCIRTIEDAHGIGQAGGIYSIVKLADGRVLSVSFGMKTWDLSTGECTGTWGEDRTGLAALQLHDGRVATGCSDGLVALWDVSPDIVPIDNNDPVLRFSGHTGPVYALTQLSNNRLASGSWDTTILIWDVSSEATSESECMSSLEGHTGFIWCLAALSGGIILVSGSNDHTIRLWHTLKGECLNVLTGHTHAVYCLELLDDGVTVASGSMDNTIRLWGFRRSNDSLQYYI